ncbi:hypothetical protein PBY51_012481 [Eleginops maclovinus]|uniref:TTF-type domain-containing protein n=2 Tax=Eleginops maclovinus TaxID=56733 RepID=A0AAN8ATG4_ELEMC|nr:hypothetical protein PBY51_012481 [Eleginops maclovinus]
MEGERHTEDDEGQRHTVEEGGQRSAEDDEAQRHTVEEGGQRSAEDDEAQRHTVEEGGQRSAEDDEAQRHTVEEGGQRSAENEYSREQGNMEIGGEEIGSSCPQHPFDPVRVKNKVINGDALTDDEKKSVLQNRWLAPQGYSYPKRTLGGKQLRYNPQWEKNYEWLSYSPSEDAAYCATCLCFNKVKGKNFSFLTKGFTDWKNAVGDKRGVIPRHSHSEGHQRATELAENFMLITQGQKKDIQSVISKQYDDKVMANRKALLSIIDIIVCLGKRNVPFRGNWEGSSENGNFNYFVNWKAQFDTTLKQHLETAAKNAKYISPQIQNDLIACCAEDIRETLINNIKTAKFFTVLADESMDISGIEQLSLCVRYVSGEGESSEIREDFLGFCPLTQQDAKTIATVILRQLTEWGLHTEYLRGQGYDGASTMSGHVSGVQKRISDVHPRAMYTHCRSHALNLVVVHGCSDLPIVRNTMSIIEEIAVFFSGSSARKGALEAETSKEGQTTKKSGIPLMSDTRWSSRSTTLSAFVEKFTAVHSVLEKMGVEKPSVSAKAATLRHSMESFETIITAVMVNEILGYIHPLTKLLQTTNLDILTAYEEARNMRQVIANQREDKGSRLCFEKATALANSIGVVPAKRRVSVRQTYRANVTTESVEDHYRINLFYPFLDHITAQLDERFAKNNKPPILASYLVPSSLKYLTPAREDEMLRWYHEDLPDQDTARQEIERWRHKFEDGPLPSFALEVLQKHNLSFFPNIKCMLKIFLTLPVTTCACERSFSAMRRLKTWLRSTMSNDRLTGLAMMHVHQKVEVDRENILRRWDASGHRRIQLAFD